MSKLDLTFVPFSIGVLKEPLTMAVLVAQKAAAEYPATASVAEGSRDAWQTETGKR
jgi:hypothetical protein